MEKLSPQFLATCRRNNGRLLRGEQMTRIETFVDAAFAFAFTMLVISIDQIPRSPAELIELSRDIPSFVFSALILGSIWMAHATWSETFGLRDRLTIFLSLLLVILVLIFVYPIKLIMQTTVEFFAVNRDLEFFYTGLFESPGWSGAEASVIFEYVSVGLILLSAILIAFYQNALRFGEELSITDDEHRYCVTNSLIWGVVAVTAAASFVIANLFAESNIQFAGFIYFSLLITIYLVTAMYSKFVP